MAMPLPRSGASHFRIVRAESVVPSLNGKTRVEGELLGIADADGSMTIAHAVEVLSADWIREHFGAGTYQIRWMGQRGGRPHLQSLGNSIAQILEDGAPEPQFRPAPPPPSAPTPAAAAAPTTPAHAASPPFGSDPFTLFAYFEDKREQAIERERDRADRALEAERERAERAAARDQALWQTLGMRPQAPSTDPMVLALLQEMRADSREVRERLRRLEEGYDDGDDGDDEAPPPYPPAAPLAAPVANAPPAPQQRPPRDMNEALSRAGVELVGNLPGIIGAVGEMMRQQPAAAPPPPPMLRPVRLPAPPPPPPPAPSATLVVSESDVKRWIDEAEAAEAATSEAPDAAQ